jgi:outer membrane protein OmpA-like peptidoglycan-associated protein
LTLPDTKVVAAAPVPVPQVNPAKLPDATESEKFEDVATPVVKMDTAPIPTPEVVEETKDEVADIAAEKVTETAAGSPETTETTPQEIAADPAPQEVTTPPAPEVTETEIQPVAEEEITVAAIAPDAGPPAAETSSELNDKLTRILFTEGDAELPKDAQITLQVIADQVKGGERQNVQLLAYGSGNSVSAARRLSLGRALAVRSKLMELGVENRQIEVRALGQPEGGGPSDRVDLLMISR